MFGSDFQFLSRPAGQTVRTSSTAPSGTLEHPLPRDKRHGPSTILRMRIRESPEPGFLHPLNFPGAEIQK
jgi:hypothetical protein